ncbi:MAG: NAD-dependent epimerase/dehydratase family protein [Chitinivibrionales bacterium]|nr:NAD-dependent epimerase/dehydratase family protein [Chitinivibrionales bacterium]
MTARVLITGGAGFIGSHLADLLLDRGYSVRVFDNLDPQVHGACDGPPAYLNHAVEFHRGDVRDSGAVRAALQGVDAVVHLAAAVGVGQSMYEMEKYTAVNTVGTAVLLEALARNPVAKLVTASSMSIYGEGLYRSADGETRHDASRSVEQLRRGRWEVYDEAGEWSPIPTPEIKHPVLSSVYALSKYDQERLVLMIGQAYNMPSVALRFFNVFGTRQALSNPYTGVLAIFASRYLNDTPPLIFEDGGQKRDFVSVKDVARACLLALENDAVTNDVINIGSGRAYSVSDIAARMAAVLGVGHIAPEITRRYRVGDIRHCYADISKARTVLSYEPKVSLDDGLVELAQWLTSQIAEDRVEMAAAELSERGLAV